MAVYNALQVSNQKVEYITSFRHRLKYIKSVGLFALVFGLFGQLMGLYQMFSVIEVAGAISPAIVAGGLKVTMISALYGVLIFLISYIVWLGLDYYFDGREVQA
ncbi:MAG TPA: MotA/TolQ/ExbB proton channel family protein [Balneolaceae bacterium]|nr:MotA/TolQ/ExbB proton channel family protein [Balneolaceae bacterium]